MPTNVRGTELQCCCRDPMTGFYRDGYCRTGPGDHGLHTVCVVMTEEFSEFSAAAGNDLSTPVPEFGFPGLTAGDRWCLCVTRWQEAFEAGYAPSVVLADAPRIARHPPGHRVVGLRRGRGVAAAAGLGGGRLFYGLRGRGHAIEDHGGDQRRAEGVHCFHASESSLSS